MVFCRPAVVFVASLWWSSIRTDQQFRLLLQQYTFLKAPWSYNFRIIVRHKNGDYEVAAARSLNEILRDWEEIQNIALMRYVSETKDPSLKTDDPTLTLIAMLYARWKEQEAKKAEKRSTYENPFPTIERVYKDIPPPPPISSDPPISSSSPSTDMDKDGPSSLPVNNTTTDNATPGLAREQSLIQPITLSSLISPPPDPPATSPSSDTKRKYNSMDIAECIEWERRRINLYTKVDVLMKKKRAHLQGVVNDYLEGLRQIVWEDSSLSSVLKQRMISCEYKRVESMRAVMSTEHNAVMACIDEEIKMLENATKVKQSIVKAQALIRGYQTRKKFKPLLRNEKHRNKCVRELVETERTYVRLLGLLVKAFVVPFREASAAKPQIFRKEDISTLFSNVEVLLSVNRELLTLLEEKLANWGPKALIGDVFTKMAPFLKIYTQYVNAYNESLNVLNRYSKVPEFQELLKKCKANPELKGMDLTSLQILPVQRVPRYELLLKEIVKATPESHPDYQNLQKATELIQEVAKTINESKRQADNTRKVMEIQGLLFFNSNEKFEDLVQPHRKFCREGAMVREVDDAVEACYLFLFSDLLLVTQKKKAFLDDSYYYVFKEAIRLIHAAAKSIPDTRTSQNGFSLSAGNKEERFFASTAAEKAEWLDTLTEVIRSVRRNIQSLRIEVENLPDENAEATKKEAEEENNKADNNSKPETNSSEPQISNSSNGSSSGSSSSNSSSSNVPTTSPVVANSRPPPKVKQVVVLYRQALQLESDIFAMPIHVKSLIPSVNYTTQNIQNLQTRVTLLSSKIVEIDLVHDNVVNLLREEKIVCALDRLMSEGLVHIDAMLKFVTNVFPRDGMARNSVIFESSSIYLQHQADYGAGGKKVLPLPFVLMSSILSWYLNISECWSVIMDKQCA